MQLLFSRYQGYRILLSEGASGTVLLWKISVPLDLFRKAVEAFDPQDRNF